MTKAAIIDANAFSKAMRPEIEDAINKEGLKIVRSEGGKLDQELRDAGLKRYKEYRDNKYAKYGQAGKFYSVCNKSVEKKQKSIKDKVTLKSNDDHIIALAIVACANTLVTDDINLISDFKDVRRINRDAGCIKNNRLESKGGQKVVQKKSPTKKAVKELIEKAKAEGFCCECLFKCGSCQGSGCQPE